MKGYTTSSAAAFDRRREQKGQGGGGRKRSAPPPLLPAPAVRGRRRRMRELFLLLRHRRPAAWVWRLISRCAILSGESAVACVGRYTDFHVWERRLSPPCPWMGPYRVARSPTASEFFGAEELGRAPDDGLAATVSARNQGNKPEKWISRFPAACRATGVIFAERGFSLTRKSR